MRKLFAIALVTVALPAWAQRPVMLVTGPAHCSLGSPSCNVPVDSGGAGVFRFTPSSHYRNTVKALVNTPGLSYAVSAVAGTLGQTRQGRGFHRLTASSQPEASWSAA